MKHNKATRYQPTEEQMQALVAIQLENMTFLFRQFNHSLANGNSFSKRIKIYADLRIKIIPKNSVNIY